jgi:hypothetical protein
LVAAGVKAAKLDSTISMEERAEIFKDLESGRPTVRLLYGESCPKCFHRYTGLCVMLMLIFKGNSDTGAMRNSGLQGKVEMDLQARGAEPICGESSNQSWCE